MVRYIGRARQRTRGNAGQNQKMSGSAGGVGRSYLVLGKISKRVTSNLTVCKTSDGKRCTKASDCSDKAKTGSCCGGCVLAPSVTAQSARGVGSPVV